MVAEIGNGTDDVIRTFSETMLPPNVGAASLGFHGFSAETIENFEEHSAVDNRTETF
jgi:hypothetical protein